MADIIIIGIIGIALLAVGMKYYRDKKQGNSGCGCGCGGCKSTSCPSAKEKD